MPQPTKSHDLNLPAWGPYSKKYAGISHIPDTSAGLRFDVSIIPGHYRRQMLIPNEKWASGHHPWEAAADLSFYTYRYEIEWKDQVYCDASFITLSEQSRLVRANLVNNTDIPQSMMLHLVAYMNFPPVRPYSDEPIRMATAFLPNGGLWVDGLDYEELQFATPRPTDGLVEDGMMRAEIRGHGLVNGSGIGDGFGGEAGDMVRYAFTLNRPIDQAAVLLRYRLKGKTPAKLRIEGATSREIELAGSDPDEFGFSQVIFPAEGLLVGEQIWQFTAISEAAVDIDGFAIVSQAQLGEVNFSEHQWTHAPEILTGPHPNTLILKYADSDTFYGMAWHHPDFWVRQYFHNELDTLLRFLVPNNYSTIWHGSGEGHFTDAFLRPISLQPHSEAAVYSLVCSGTEAEVIRMLDVFVGQPVEAHETAYQVGREMAVSPESTPSGEKYRFSQERMTATELMNVVYPVYTRRQFIRHNAPGKWWDCLYTWDAGFIGLGLLELDFQRAIDCLNAYVTDPGDEHTAFVHHGTLVPTQMYLFQEIWNRTQDQSFLENFYPSMRQFYQFLAGHLGSSTTRRLQSNLLMTWEYFFESGGWDDYPAQLHVLEDYEDFGNIQESGIKINVACAAITAHLIRSAKILHTAAAALGIESDQQDYEADIAMFTDALQKFAWDENAGYFSYVMHDDAGQPTGHLMHESGFNFNMGLDGVMPLISGICTPEQEEGLLDKLQDPQRFWTNLGLSTIDQTAPYYSKEGYWNGSVWFPHQWFIWKTALDLGQGEFAYKIAHTALDLWKGEVEASYYCFEHFIIETGRGAGWHQFSGLSSPILNWFHAYYRVGQLSVGFDVWVDAQQFSDDNRSFTGQLRRAGALRPAVVLINMQAGYQYDVYGNDQQLDVLEINPGSLQITVPFDSQVGQLQVKEKGK